MLSPDYVWVIDASRTGTGMEQCAMRLLGTNRAVRAEARPFRKVGKLAKLAFTDRYRAALRQGVAAAVEHRDVPFTRDYETVIDVGANRGQFALFALEHFAASRVVCVEPLPDAAATLRRLFQGVPAVEVIECAA